MSGLPSVTVIGTLVQDPELRFTPAGAAVVNFTIAANSRRLNKQTNQWEDGDATFLRCNLWRDAAEHVAESLSRGCRVIAVGELKQRNFETREGEKRTVMELEVDEVGPSLKWANAKPAKATRGSDAPRGSAPAEDPWGAAPPAGAGPAQDDEPPF
jgi:single-strand DNA-binding protein